MEIQNAETLSAFLKRDEYIDNEKLLWNLYGTEVFFSELKGYLAKLFSKRLSIHKAPDLTLPPFWKRYTGSYIRNSHAIIIYACYAVNHTPWILL